MRHAHKKTVKRRNRRWIALGAVVVVALAGGALWLWPALGPEAKGTPRLAVDRTEINLGFQPFEQHVRATFTLTNVGDGPLTIAEAPRVRVVQGC